MKLKFPEGGGWVRLVVAEDALEGSWLEGGAPNGVQGEEVEKGA